MKLLSRDKDILSIRDQFSLFDSLLEDRIRNLMPKLMKETGTEMWLVLCQEYNEDPVFKSLTPSLVKNASRTSCLVFSLKGDEYRAISLSRPNPRLARYYEQAYNPRTEDQFDAIARVVKDRAPSKIAIDICNDCAMADGLSQTMWTRLKEALPGAEFVTDGQMAIRWLSTRSKRELQIYPEVYRISMTILREAYSRDVIHPGVTTTTDVEYYIMQRMNEMGLDFWFTPDVDLQRKGCSEPRISEETIQEGDLLHTDFGLVYLGGLYTDTQRLGYVLRTTQEEKSIPQGILDGFAKGNQFQDIVRSNYILGRTGNEIFHASVEEAKKKGLHPLLYSHPIGYYGHSAGPTIGLWDHQDSIPGAGDQKLYKDTCYALELSDTEFVPEWNQDVCFMLEETIACTGSGVTNFMDDRRKIIEVI